MIKIDGAHGEGGGQILRTSLSLSMLTGQAVKIDRIRAGRAKPGLLRQHLTAVNAAAEICSAKVSGNEIGSGVLTFVPQRIKGGCYHFSIGTAGSSTLVLQTVLPALLMAEGPSKIVIEGGTHNSGAPHFDFIDRVFLPVLRRMGACVDAKIDCHGFYPAGGGKITVLVTPSQFMPIVLTVRGARRGLQIKALTANLPAEIAVDEARLVADALDGDAEQIVSRVESSGPGNVVMLTAEYEHITEMFTGFGEYGVPREEVARRVIDQARRFEHASGAVGVFLADQLLLPLALAGGGEFRTLTPSPHTLTNIETIKKFLPVAIECRENGRDDWKIRIEK